jgi:phospholipid transport system substrate-binding protein
MALHPTLFRENKMPERIARYLLSLALSLFATAPLAHDPGPEAMLQAVSVKVFDQMLQDPAFQAERAANVIALVEDNIAPLFDFSRMTRLAMARNWRLATIEQQREITQEFETLLVRSYSAALANYRGETVDFKQMHAAPLATEVIVRSQLRQPGQQGLTLDYHMEQTEAGWKIYDVKVAGVRLVTTYRDVFAEKVRESGVDGLLRSLADGNRGGAPRFNLVRDSFWQKSRVLYQMFQDLLRRELN